MSSISLVFNIVTQDYSSLFQYYIGDALCKDNVNNNSNKFENTFKDKPTDPTLENNGSVSDEIVDNNNNNNCNGNNNNNNNNNILILF